MIDYRSFPEQLVKPIVAGEIRLQVGKRRCAFVSEYKLNFAKLHGLKPRCGLEPIAETRERRRCHRLENVHLRHQRLHDCPYPLERMNRPEEIARGEISPYFLELMEQLLEPELVGLMNDNEQHLVVLGGAGTWLLKRAQLLKIEIACVSQRRHIRHAPCARACVNGGSTAASGDVTSTPTLLASSRDCSIHLPPPDLAIG